MSLDYLQKRMSQLSGRADPQKEVAEVLTELLKIVRDDHTVLLAVASKAGVTIDDIAAVLKSEDRSRSDYSDGHYQADAARIYERIAPSRGT